MPTIPEAAIRRFLVVRYEAEQGRARLTLRSVNLHRAPCNKTWFYCRVEYMFCCTVSNEQQGFQNQLLWPGNRKHLFLFQQLFLTQKTLYVLSNRFVKRNVSPSVINFRQTFNSIHLHPQ